MSKLTENNLLTKSRFLKYSLLASISVGSIIAAPFESAASSVEQGSFKRSKSTDSLTDVVPRKEELLKHVTRSRSIGRMPSDRQASRDRSKQASRQNDSSTLAPALNISVNPVVQTTNDSILFKTANNLSNRLELKKEEIKSSNFTEATVQESRKDFVPKYTSTPIKPTQAASQLSKRSNPVSKQLSFEGTTSNAQSTTIPFQQQGAEKKAQKKIRQKEKKIAEAAAKQVIEEEKNRKKENEEKAKAEDIKRIKGSISQQMQTILNYNETVQNELSKPKVKEIIAEKKLNKQKEAQDIVSKINKKAEGIKKVVSEAQKVANSAEGKTSKKELEKLNKKMKNYCEQVIKKLNKEPTIEVDIENLNLLISTVPIAPPISTIPTKQATMPLTSYVQGTQGRLNTTPQVENLQEKKPQVGEDGYLRPKSKQEKDYFQVIDESTGDEKQQQDKARSKDLYNKLIEQPGQVNKALKILRDENAQKNTSEVSSEGKKAVLPTQATKGQVLEHAPNTRQSKQKSDNSSSVSFDTDEAPRFSEDLRYTQEQSLVNQTNSNATPINTNADRTRDELLRLQTEIQNGKRRLENTQSTSTQAPQIQQQINQLSEANTKIYDILDKSESKPSILNQVSIEEIKEEAFGLDAKVLGALAYTDHSTNKVISNSKNLDEELAIALNGDPDSDDELTWDETGDIFSLSGDEESSDDDNQSKPQEAREGEVADLETQETREEERRLLPSGDYKNELLSDGRESEESELEEENDNNDSGIATDVEEETAEQVSNSEGSDSEVIEISAELPEAKEIEQVKQEILQATPTTNSQHKIVAMVKSPILARLDSSSAAAVAAGDEESHIQRGLWMRGMYGTNNQGRVNNINGYKGANKGATIGFDVEIENNIIGIAYSNVHSVFKFKNNKNNDKEIIDSHVISIYGQKELPKNFVAQALVSASKNFIKNKTTYSLGYAKFKSNVKHRNHSYNAEALLNYNHFMKNNLIITPNIGLRYGKSRDGIYNETGISVQEIALTMKENNILSGIIGTKVKIPLKDVLKFNNLGLTLQGAVEHNFDEKTQRVNRVIQIQDNKFTQDYIIPKQPKTAYNLGTSIMGSIKNTTISLEYNYFLNNNYQSHQGSIKLKINL